MKTNRQSLNANRRPLWPDPAETRAIQAMLFWSDELLRAHAERVGQLQSQGLPRSAAALLAFRELQPQAEPHRRQA